MSLNWLNPKIIICVLPEGLHVLFIVGDVGQMVVWVMVELLTKLALLKRAIKLIVILRRI